MRCLLPYLMAGLGPDITADHRAASLMILTQLASQATLSDTLVTGQSCRTPDCANPAQIARLLWSTCAHRSCADTTHCQVSLKFNKAHHVLILLYENLERLAKGCCHLS